MTNDKQDYPDWVLVTRFGTFEGPTMIALNKERETELKQLKDMTLWNRCCEKWVHKHDQG